MVNAVVALRNEKASLRIRIRSKRLAIPRKVAALIRNALTAQADGKTAILLSAAATRKLLSAWPTPIVLCGPQAANAVAYPASSIETYFAWAPLHPVAEAYRAYRNMPCDAPSRDMAAALYAVRQDAELFDLSGPGTIDVQENGKLRFTETTGGKHRSLIVRGTGGNAQTNNREAPRLGERVIPHTFQFLR